VTTATVPVKGVQSLELYWGFAAQQSQGVFGAGTPGIVGPSTSGPAGGTIGPIGITGPGENPGGCWARAEVKEAIIGKQNKNRLNIIQLHHLGITNFQ
jgi:hypothetical protein